MHRPHPDAGPLDAGVDAAAPLVPSTGADERMWRAYVDALQKGRDAMRSKKYDDAIAAFNEAIALKPRDPRGLFERATANVLAKHPESALLDLESARDRPWSEGLAVQIEYEIGVAREATGDAEGARAAFAAIQNIHPSVRAGEKLFHKSACDADIDPRHVAGTKAADWLAAWKVLATDYARNHDMLGVLPVTTNDDARAALCVHGCEGAGPWTLAFGDDERELALALPGTNGALVLFPRIGRSRERPCASEDTVTIDTTQTPAHVIVRSDPLERTFTQENILHERVECDSTLKGCAAECLERGWSERDWWVDLKTATRVLAIERVGRVVGADRNGRVRINRVGDDVFVKGAMCDERLPLVQAK